MPPETFELTNILLRHGNSKIIAIRVPLNYPIRLLNREKTICDTSKHISEHICSLGASDSLPFFHYFLLLYYRYVEYIGISLPCLGFLAADFACIVAGEASINPELACELTDPAVYDLLYLRLMCRATFNLTTGPVCFRISTAC